MGVYGVLDKWHILRINHYLYVKLNDLMFQLNLKIALRNLWKSKGYAALNIFGLAVGFAGFILILLYANHEYSYDTWNPDADQVYRIGVKAGAGQEEYASNPGELAPALKNAAPEIESFARYYTWDLHQRLLTYGGKEFYVDHIMGVDSSWFAAFPYKFLYGDPKRMLISADDIVLSSNIAELYFGKQNPVGKSLVMNGKKTYIVSGVYEQPETPEHLDHDGFVKMSSQGDGWNNGNFYSYIKVKKGTDLALLSEKINRALVHLPITKDNPWIKDIKITLTPVKDIYLQAAAVQDPAKRGNAKTVTILVLFSALLLVIACINFTNLSIAKSIKRAKETGIRKVMGAGRGSLATYFLTETALQCIVSLLLALVIAEIALPALNTVMDLNLALFSYSFPAMLTVEVLGALLLVIFFSGGYTAFFLANYDPIKVLKGNFSRSNLSLWWRKTLISIQFLVATVFIVCLLIIKQQVNYMKNKDVGFDREHVAIFKIRKQETRANFAQIKARLTNIPGVKSVSRVNYFPGSNDIQIIGREFDGQAVEDLSVVTVDFDYFEVMGIAPKFGRMPSVQFGTDSTAVVVNEAAVKKYGLQKLIGHKWIDNRTIVGVVKDQVQSGMEKNTDPTAFMIESKGTNGANHVVVKIESNNVQQTIAQIKATWESIEPFPFQFNWLDQTFEQIYVQYIRLDKIFNIFTYVTIALAIIGLFALASFTVQERTREIGVRKVLGADTSEILKLINGGFLVLVLSANVIAIPVAYILSRNWLNGFAFRTSITVWPFVIAVVVSIMITLITVSLQAYRAAKANPVDALKYE
ncbi:putative FtsX-related transmembrane transport protein [Pedobacter sp. BAL39]|nr:putative FtsX-related transmembrane transport protein [Pedobacter sp. BAL39]